ncbi:hypothetical protein CQA53_02730 [Helicobacter didelphidarum]|uniref:Uncharacterized protein n=1 Tax=Helicobacter didelphidarum TaxID=2040648 RepID=A0A3D8IP61_9HELI|nr:hypothetical protein [Helicobacter didelphidarum]RDU66705.1 hypothetical protein CQA53_02730 [Helicobacter didelphidarum]
MFYSKVVFIALCLGCNFLFAKINLDKERAKTITWYQDNCIKAKKQSDNLCNGFKFMLSAEKVKQDLEKKYGKDTESLYNDTSYNNIKKYETYALFYGSKLNGNDLAVIDNAGLEFFDMEDKFIQGTSLFNLARFSSVYLTFRVGFGHGGDSMDCVAEAKNEKEFDKCLSKDSEPEAENQRN